MQTKQEDDVVRVSAEEVAAAVAPSARAARPSSGAAKAAPTTSQDQLAKLSLGLAILGVPLAGFVLGPIAILFGSLALSQNQTYARRGLVFAIIGTSLGILEFVGWTLGIWLLLSRPAAEPHKAAPPLLGLAQPASGVSEAPPHIRTALQANVRILCAEPAATSQGAGVVVAKSAEHVLVLTNQHVVDCAKRTPDALLVASITGDEAKASVVWLAPDAVDLALLRVRALRDTNAVALGETIPKVGDPVFAVGNPLGLEATYITGSVSALRAVPFGPHTIRVLQLQAAVNPGNSGGGLYSERGGLLGITTWIADRQVAQGIGFAISSADAVSLLRRAGKPWDLIQASRLEVQASP